MTKAMKLVFFFLLLSMQIWAKPVVVVGYFDPFGGARVNSSEVVAKKVSEKLKDHPELQIKLCALSTVFDKSFFELQKCLNELPEMPQFILGLGESNCNFKIETIVKNLDHTFGPDNEGNERSDSQIIPSAPLHLGLYYPVREMFCALSRKDRKKIQVSNSAGSFVCNNLAFQFSWNYSHLPFGFIHVPAHSCRGIDVKINKAVENLSLMIPEAIKAREIIKHPISSAELEKLRDSFQRDQCEYEFYQRAKGIDERGLWPF